MSFFSGSKGELSVIFDIGSQNIGVALVLKRDGDKPQIIWTHREDFVTRENRAPRELLEAMLSALKKTNEILEKDIVSELHAKDLPLPSSVQCILSSPWVHIEQKTVVLAFERPTLITQKIVNDTVNKEMTSFESAGFTLIEKTITGLKINGYAVKNPYNKKVVSLEISFTIATTPREILDLIDGSVSAKKADTKAFSSMAYHAIKELFQGNDFLFMAIEDNSTELAIVRDGVLVLHTSIFSGSNALIEGVAKECGVSFDEARSLMRLSFKKNLDPTLTDKIARAIKEERDLWRQEIETSIENAGGLFVLPRTSFFIASDIGFVADIVKNQNISEFGINQTPLDVVLLDSVALKDKIIFGDTTYADARLGLLAMARFNIRANR